MDNINQIKNKLKNIDINNNLGELYSLFANLFINLDSQQNSIQNYLEFLLVNDDLQIMLSTIFDEASEISTDVYTNISNSSVMRSLPTEYYEEPWRSRKLITAIFEHQPRTIQLLQEMVKFWQKENAMYM